MLGELDHPKEFDISLSNVSHVIESLEYDKDKKQVIGKVRLLNTAKGRDAQALVEDGIPLHISSRAAGTVDPQSGKVKIKKMFTYDLVADPGFANAELKRVNENYGFDNDDSLFIYDISENVQEKNISNQNMNNEFVKSEDFQKYTEYVNGVLESFKQKAESMNTAADAEKVDKLIKYSETIAEQVNKIEDYSNYLAEKLEKTISYTNYLAENSNNIVAYADYLAEELNNADVNESLKEKVENLTKYADYTCKSVNDIIKYNNYLAENLDNAVKYADYTCENVNNLVNYTNYLGENLNNSIQYSEYLKENVENSIKYSEYIKENVEHLNDYADYTCENVNNLVEYSNYLGENLETSIQYSDYIKENVEELQDAPVVEHAVAETTSKSSIDDKISKLISIAEANANGGFSFMNLLSKDKKEQFKTLGADKQARIIESMNKGLVTSTIQADKIFEAAIAPTQQPKSFEELIPEKYKEKWNALSEQRKIQIMNESRFYPMNTPYQINNFWSTRDLRSYTVNPVYQQKNTAVNENNQTNVENNSNNISEEFKQGLISKVRMNMGN